MKKILMGLIMTGVAYVAHAQNGQGMQIDRTNISYAPNATYQNNSQFYNKDNHSATITPHIMSNGNGEYSQPGMSNQMNRSSFNGELTPNRSVNTTVNNYDSRIDNSNVNTVVDKAQVIAPSNMPAKAYAPERRP